LNIPELFDIYQWIAATPQRQQEIVDAVLAHLPEFEFVTLRTYSGPGQNRLIPIATFRQNGEGVLFNLIPGGSFQMGFSDKEIESFKSVVREAELTRDDAEMAGSVASRPSGKRPVHKVTLKPFLLAQLPLRLTEAARILDVDPESDEAPYIGEVEFDMAGFFEANVDSFLAKSGYLLPSESQWEYACRALSETPFWWGEALPNGSEWTEDIENAAEIDRCSNSFGLVNMAANPELCADKWHDSYENAPDDGSAWIENESDSKRVTRGGAAFLYPWQGTGEWVMMLSSSRCTSDISDIGLAIRPVYPLDIF
jgi:formylglycine-generating enzyme required for sulfatase activity